MSGDRRIDGILSPARVRNLWQREAAPSPPTPDPDAMALHQRAMALWTQLVTGLSTAGDISPDTAEILIARVAEAELNGTTATRIPESAEAQPAHTAEAVFASAPEALLAEELRVLLNRLAPPPAWPREEPTDAISYDRAAGSFAAESTGDPATAGSAGDPAAAEEIEVVLNRLEDLAEARRLDRRRSVRGRRHG